MKSTEKLDDYLREHPEVDNDELPWNEYDWEAEDPCCRFESFDRVGWCKVSWENNLLSQGFDLLDPYKSSLCVCACLYLDYEAP